jgi:DNA-binding NarL/FixJ family response regulator
MIVDDHDVVRQGVRALINEVPDWTVCAEAADGADALQLATETKPDIVIVDIAMPGTSGIDLIIQLKELLPEVAILVLTLHESERIASRALRAGARGYVFKSDPAHQLVEAISSLSRGHPFFSPAVSEDLLQFYLNPVRADDEDQLTSRERQLAKLVAEGKSNKQIAILLKVSVKTVETHRSSMMKKIGAKSSADITLYAVRNKLVLF